MKMKSEDSVTKVTRNVDYPEIKKQLQKSFSVLKHCVQVWRETETSAKSHLSKIVNLTEQYQCCSQVETHDLPMKADFPDVKERLLYKISGEISEQIDLLKIQSQRLCECSERIAKQYEHCMSHYGRHSTLEDLPDITRKTTLYPSISDMLEWVEESETCLRESSQCKKILLDMFTPQDCNVDTFETSWFSSDLEMLQQLEEYLAYVSSFVELKIS